MKKPLLEDYGITNKDISEIEAIDKRFRIIFPWVIGVISFIFLMRYGYHLVDDTRYITSLIGLVLADAFYAFIIAAIVEKLAPKLIGYLLCLKWQRYRSVKTFEKDSANYMQWWIRTKEYFWDSLNGKQFESEVAFLLSRLGYKASLTPASGDKGIDIILNDGTIIQCKAHGKPVGPAVIRELYGVLNAPETEAKRGILISKNGFTRGVKDFAKGKPIDLWDLSALIEMQRKLELD